MHKLLKLLRNLTIVGMFLFVLTFIVYFFNLDMKMTSAIEPILDKHYDKIKRERKL